MCTGKHKKPFIKIEQYDLKREQITDKKYVKIIYSLEALCGTVIDVIW